MTFSGKLSHKMRHKLSHIASFNSVDSPVDNSDKTGRDRHLIKRNKRYYYRRRVPKAAEALDDRAPFIQIALKTTDIAVARMKRDLLEDADNLFWAELSLKDDAEKARARYQAALKRVEALGFAYKTSRDIANLSFNELFKRIDIAKTQPNNEALSDSILGTIPIPKTPITKAEEIYFKEITPNQLARKSDGQKKHWINERKLSLNYLKTQIGDKDVDDITRDDALTFYRYLNKFVIENERSSSWGKRQLGNVRKFFDDYFSYIGQADRTNPFTGLTFREFTISRPPFSVEWITQKIFRIGALDSLNTEARHILFTLIDTGARMGEICNLGADDIHLDTDYPYIEIKPRNDPNNPREIKTNSSIRTVPLIGVAYAALKQHPNGFIRYRDKETHLSNTLNKYFRTNGLFETEKHVIYSFRHSFEDRMKEADLDSELRRALMGHTIDRPKYGSGGRLKWQWEQLKKIELPFDEKIIGQ